MGVYTNRLYIHYTTAKGFEQCRSVRDAAAARKAMLRLRTTPVFLKWCRRDLVIRPSSDRIVGAANQGDGKPCWVAEWLD